MAFLDLQHEKIGALEQVGVLSRLRKLFPRLSDDELVRRVDDDFESLVDDILDRKGDLKCHKLA